MQELIDIIKAAGRYLQLSQPAEQTIGNITRRVVHLLREEAKAALLEAKEKEMGVSGSGSGMGSLSNSISDLHLATAFGGHRGTGAGGAIPSHLAQSRPDRHRARPTQSHRSTTRLTQAGMPARTRSSQADPRPLPTLPSGSLPPSSSSESHPGSSAFVHGSFSISDLVAAGAMATSTSSSLAHTPADGSYASTPHASLSRKGSGVFDSSFTQLSQQMSGVSLTEDPAGERRPSRRCSAVEAGWRRRSWTMKRGRLGQR